MEDNLSISELNAILAASRKVEFGRQKFAAALKGIQLDDETSETTTFEEVEARAKAKAAGMSLEEYEFADLGIAVETEVNDDNSD